MYEVRQNLCRATHDAAITDESCQMIIDMFLTYLNVLRHEKGQLAAFWMAYVELTEKVTGLSIFPAYGVWFIGALPWTKSITQYIFPSTMPKC